ncbi:hypothetical protein K9U40_22555 [Xanthobacter autotrophicus]|uniref:hypothetical protein n=1 Tax=Xanthobacter TaxID=279 RepID=UPI0024ABE0A9|nr:hypothetical protein [Xanthobacter autotrophicus]MDI4667081.1 hypothetical protein [Xanthobacter autotrophicus]
MPKPTAAANATAMPTSSRRAFLKAGGALGTIAALAVPVAVLPKVEAAEQQDAELLALGRELETLWARERELAAECSRLSALAEQMQPAPAPLVLAFELNGEHLLEEKSGQLWVNFRLHDWLRAYDAMWNSPTRQQQPLVAEVLAALGEWQKGGEEAERLSGAAAADDAFEDVTDAISALCDRIVAAPAMSPAGLMVKMRALDWCYPDGTAAAVLRKQADDEEEVTSVRLAASAFRDALAILGVGGAHV